MAELVQTTGDGTLVEFGSVVDAVLCAVAMQEAVAERQAAAPPERRLVLRIGINLGDVVADGADILGDGVNVAARLEQLCDPGGVLVSETVREHVGNRIDLAFEDIGPQLLKNIERPVRAHRLILAGTQSGSAAIIAGPWRTRVDRTRPSVAVLPFENLSRDPDQDYFSEGIAEDLITDLSKISGLQVAGRRSTFGMREPAGNSMRDVARDERPAEVSSPAGRPCAGGQHPPRRQPVRITARLGRWRHRHPGLGGPLRSDARRHLRGAGRHHAPRLSRRSRSACCRPRRKPWRVPRPANSRPTATTCGGWSCWPGT